MPRKNPLPRAEAEVCQRLVRFRKLTRISRVAFAAQAGINSTLLKNYEFERAPLRYDVGAAICRAYELNPVWLATEEGDWKGCFYDSGWGATVNPRKSFRVAIIKNRAAIEQLRAEAKARFDALLDIEEKASARGGGHAAKIQSFEAHLAFLRSAQEIALLPCSGPLVALYSQQLKMPIDTPELPILIQRVNAATALHGAKARLAKAIGVTSGNLSNVLSGKNEPGGALTLKLLRWVTEEEAAQQSKDPGRVISTAGAVDPKQQITTNEKATTGRRKR